MLIWEEAFINGFQTDKDYLNKDQVFISQKITVFYTNELISFDITTLLCLAKSCLINYQLTISQPLNDANRQKMICHYKAKQLFSLLTIRYSD